MSSESLRNFVRRRSATARHSARAASSVSCTKAVRMAAATMARLLTPACAIAVALVRSLRRPLAVSRAREAFDLDVHHARGDEGQHLPEEILIGALLKRLLHCHSVDGHGIRFLSVRVWEPEPTASRPMPPTSP